MVEEEKLIYRFIRTPECKHKGKGMRRQNAIKKMSSVQAPDRSSNSSRRAVKRKVFRFLESGEAKSRASHLYDAAIAILVLSTLSLGVLKTIKDLDKLWLQNTRLITEWVLLVVLVVEYSLRIWSSSAHGTYGASGGLLKYITTPHMIIDAFIIISSACAIVTMSMQRSRYMYLLELMRVLKFDRNRGAFVSFWKVFQDHSKELLTCWYMGFIMVVFLSFLVYASEERSSRSNDTDTQMDNLFNGVYWGVISMTTIGYGDLVPQTTSGKVIICVFALFGTCFLAMPAGIIGSGFALQVIQHQKEKHVNRQRRPAAILLQSLWRKYAARADLASTWVSHIQNREENLCKVKKKNHIHYDMENGGLDVHSSTRSLCDTPHTPRKFLHNDRNSPDTPLMPRKMLSYVSDRSLPDTPLMPRKVLQVTSLTPAEKRAIQFIRLLKCITATKNFRQARRPYDERDILDQFNKDQIEMFAKMKDLKSRVDSCAKNSDQRIQENKKQIMQLVGKVELIGRSVCENKEMLRQLLENQKKILGIDVESVETLPLSDGLADCVFQADDENEEGSSPKVRKKQDKGSRFRGEGPPKILVEIPETDDEL